MSVVRGILYLEEVEVGDFLEEKLVTDTVVYEVVGKSETSVKVRRCTMGQTLQREDRSGNGWPQLWIEALPNENGKVSFCRENKSKGLCSGGGRALRKASFRNEKPCFYVDLRE